MSNFQTKCDQCGFISRLCLHELALLIEVKAAAKKLAIACAEDGSSPYRFMGADLLGLLLDEEETISCLDTKV